MTLSNPEYSILKKKPHSFASTRQEGLEMDAFIEEETDLPELLHENDFGEYYALQDFEE